MTTRTKTVRGLIVWAALALLCATLGFSGKEDTAATKNTAQDSAAVAEPAKPEAVPATEPAKELTLKLGGGVTMKMVLIPAGKFLMGSPDEEKKAAVKEVVAAGIPEVQASDALKDEVQHEVTISKPFYLGITHVTVDQFAAFVKDSGYKTDAEKDGWGIGFEIKDGKIDFKKMDGGSWRNPSFDQKGDHPVVQVSWNDARAFCDWLSKKGGKTVVLPTESQWEYACRAGSKTAYPWGDNPDDGKGWANCADQSLKKKLPNAPAEWKFFSWDDGFVFTSPVGSFKANAFGLYDMNGNAWQWCQDCYGDYEKGAVTDPTGADAGGLRVLRGGSWYLTPRALPLGGPLREQSWQPERRHRLPGGGGGGRGLALTLCTLSSYPLPFLGYRGEAPVRCKNCGLGHRMVERVWAVWPPRAAWRVLEQQSEELPLGEPQQEQS